MGRSEFASGILYKQGTLYRDFTRTLVHNIDRSAQALAKMCELENPHAWDRDQWQAYHLTAINLQASALSAQRDQYRLLSSAASAVERERQEMVVKAVHPRYTLPEQPNKPASRKLLSEEMQSLHHFVRKGHGGLEVWQRLKVLMSFRTVVR